MSSSFYDSLYSSPGPYQAYSSTSRLQDVRPGRDVHYPTVSHAATSDVNRTGFLEMPPPPYHDLANPYTTSLPNVPTYSQSYEQATHTPPNRLRKKASAWVSKLDLSRHQPNNDPRNVVAWQSNADLAARPDPNRFNEGPVVQSMNQSAALCDRVAARLTDVFSRAGDAEEEQVEVQDLMRGLSREERGTAEQPRSGIIDFKKTWLYANSRLPPHMLPMKFYLDTWRLLCVAAQASQDAYRRPRKDERADHIEADWRAGTKAMVIRSHSVDDKNMIVLAIRGSRKNFIDWSVNFGTAPTQPRGFLDDEGNACHSGFLQVARKSVHPIAQRLLSLLSERPDQTSYPSLLITGHSAGGAVANLLYMHMMATSERAESELNVLTPYFKRICCVTFGVPPLSFLPLQKPPGKKFAKCEFFSFVNEGDLIVRADRQYLKTVAGIIAAPAPAKVSNDPPTRTLASASRLTLGNGKHASSPPRPIRWNVTPATLSNAGRLVLLRTKPGQSQAVEAVQVTDQELRGVVFGDPEMHSMVLYKNRVLELATAAITGQAAG